MNTRGNVIERRNLRDSFLGVEDPLKPGKEPLVNVCHLPNLLDAVAKLEGRVDCEDSLVSRVDKFFVNVLDEVVLVSEHISLKQYSKGGPAHL